MRVRALEWRDGILYLLDQRELPHREIWLELMDWQSVELAIRDMAVRGAPAIGIAAAYGIALAAQSGSNLQEAYAGLAASRPTAVNLFWALARMNSLGNANVSELLGEAKRIESEDYELNKSIAENGMRIIPNNATILTICNTGALATGGHGTALGIVRSAHEASKLKHVYACETRPRQQGIKLTAWELLQENIPFSVIADSASGSLFFQNKIDLVIVGADRIAANGDTANKIGTYSLAVLAKHHDVLFYVAAPSTTIDPMTSTGAEIPIEERNSEELTEINGVQVAPPNCPVFNPAFDVTPNSLITGIISEHGIHRPPYKFDK